MIVVMKLKETELQNQLNTLNTDIETENVQGKDLLTDKDASVLNLTNQVNDLENECNVMTDENKNLTIEINDLKAELDKC